MMTMNLNEHFRKLYSYKGDKVFGYLKDLHDKYAKKKTLVDMFSAVAHYNADGLCASYSIAFLIVKAGKSNMIG